MAVINYSVPATGGIVLLDFPGTASGTYTLQRSQDGGSTWMTLFTGQAYVNPVGDVISPRFVDAGDGTAVPLDQATSYLYQYTDGSGIPVTTPSITPASRMSIDRDYVTEILIRAIQAGMDGLTPPSTINRAHVLHAMPLELGGAPRLPIITVNLDYGPTSQYFPLGVGINTSPDNQDTRTAQVIRKYSITALCMTVPEREFYRDAIIAIMTVVAPTVFAALWDDTAFRYQAYSSQTAKEERVPGFYFAQVMVELEGSFNVSSVTNNGVIDYIDLNGQEIAGL